MTVTISLAEYAELLRYRVEAEQRRGGRPSGMERGYAAAIDLVGPALVRGANLIAAADDLVSGLLRKVSK